MSHFLPYLVVGLVSGSVYGLAGVGLTLTYKTSGVFNFAHGTVAAAVAFVFYDLRTLHHIPTVLAGIVCLCVVAPGIGALLELMTRSLAQASTLSRIVATLGLVIAIQQLAVIKFGAVTRQFAPIFPTRTVRLVGVNVGIDQLIVVAVAVVCTAGLTTLLNRSRLGLGMRAVVDSSDLVELSARNSRSIRRTAWIIGSVFAGLSGILLAPTLGLDATLLTLLVVQAFGAAAIGLFRSLPMTFAGGAIIGVGASLATKYVASVSWLGGLPASLPFVVLFVLLLVAPRSQLVAVSVEKPAPARPPFFTRARSRYVSTAIGLVVLLGVPALVGNRLSTYSEGLAYAIVFLSLVLLERTSGQISLAQLSFAAVGASSFHHFAGSGHLPWLVALLLSGLVTLLVGVVVSIPAIRLSGLYLALATFGFGLVMQNLFYNLAIMFGSSMSALGAPRPAMATSDTAYYYLLLVIAFASLGFVVLIRRARLGRLLRAMADSPLALNTYGANLTTMKVLVFAASAFLAGLGGALLGPVTGQTSSTPFSAIASLLLVVILTVQARVSDLAAPFTAAFAMTVLPAYITNASVNQWLPVVFGVAAIAIASRPALPSGAGGMLGKLETLARQRRPHAGLAAVRMSELLSRPPAGADAL